jgi:ribosome biogenesis GTPase
MNNIKNGLIIKAISGFYYVKLKDEIVECHARGIFRKDGISPLVGDYVDVIVENDSATITELSPRKNYLERPPLANLDQLIIVASNTKPEPNPLIIDKMTAIADYKGIEPFIVFSKVDLKLNEELYAIYRKAGFKVFVVSIFDDKEIEKFKQLLSNKVSVFAGSSGVGKSSLLNKIFPKLGLKTGDISERNQRGKHTTRYTQLFALENGGYVADTAGFSSLESTQLEHISKEDLQFAFREFKPFINTCKFTGCSHINIKGCAIIDAVNSGVIQKQRYDSYVAMYNDVKDFKEWDSKGSK